MIHSQISLLWAQQGGGELIGLIIFVLIIVFNAVKSMFEARFAEAEKNRQKELAQTELELSEPEPVPAPPRRESQRPVRKRMSSYESSTETEQRKSRAPLSRELGVQGEGARFDADPGTLETAHLVAPSIEPTVKPTLESMTGIYEAAPTVTELGDQPLTLDIQKLIAKPEGLRQAIILAEILKRPEI